MTLGGGWKAIQAEMGDLNLILPYTCHEALGITHITSLCPSLICNSSENLLEPTDIIYYQDQGHWQQE